MKSIFSKLLKKNKEQRNANHFFEEETNKKENLHRGLNYSNKDNLFFFRVFLIKINLRI